MTTDASSNKDLDPMQIELESRYMTEFPGFDPATWAAMAYYSKGIRTKMAGSYLPNVLAILHSLSATR